MRRKLAELELEVDRSQGWVRGGTKQEARACALIGHCRVARTMQKGLCKHCEICVLALGCGHAMHHSDCQLLGRISDTLLECLDDCQERLLSVHKCNVHVAAMKQHKKATQQARIVLRFCKVPRPRCAGKARAGAGGAAARTGGAAVRHEAAAGGHAGRKRGARAAARPRRPRARRVHLPHHAGALSTH